MEAARKDVAPVRGAAHPAADDLAWRSAAPPPPAEVLADAPVAEATEIAAVQDALDHVPATRRGMREEAAGNHAARVPRRRAAELCVRTQHSKMPALPLDVHQAQRRRRSATR